MTDLTDTELDALAERLFRAWMPHESGLDAWEAAAREAARYFAERERERLEPLRGAVEELDNAISYSRIMQQREQIEQEARTLLENTR